MALILDQVIRVRDTGFGLQMQTGVGCVCVRSQPAIGELELQPDRAELDAVVGVEIELDAVEESEWNLFVAVADAAAIGAEREPAFGIELELTVCIEAVAGRHIAGELALGLRDGEVATDREATGEFQRARSDLRARSCCRPNNASSAQ